MLALCAPSAIGLALTRYGFVIDQDACIGCHACTVACKAEHDVPLGVNRTWVKYIETGTFPDTRRKFSVMRCNHCADAPCVAICPTTALIKRADGIVDFDAANCIGCKACMNACPYDAIYIDPASDTAAKCNYCAHKIDVGLEPACVPVCPTQAIIAGDLDDPRTRIAQVFARERLAVRAPEQGTQPQLFYKGADQASLDPLRSRITVDGMIWADLLPTHATLPVAGVAGAPAQPATAEPGRTVYTTAHAMAWKGRVSAYLVTKGIAGGVLMVAALLALGGREGSALVRLVAPAVALLFGALTGGLLVADLRRPERFWFLFTSRANWGSWLVRGALVLLLHAGVAGAWLVAGILDAGGAVRWLAVPGALAGAAAAGYSAYLFAQCEGRDLWQSPLVLPQLLAQAVTAGAAALVLLGPPAGVDPSAGRTLAVTLAAGMAAVLALFLLEVSTSATARVEAAVALLTRGPEAPRFWSGLAAGAVATALALGGLAPVAAVAALAALVLTEHAFVRAGQLVPLS